MNIVPEKFKLNKFQYTRIPENSEFIKKAMTIRVPPRSSEEVVADFTSRKMDVMNSSISQSLEDYETYVESLNKPTETPVETPNDASDDLPSDET